MKYNKYNAEYVRQRVGGSYERAVDVYALVALVYDHPAKAHTKAWERAIRIVCSRREKDAVA